MTLTHQSTIQRCRVNWNRDSLCSSWVIDIGKTAMGPRTRAKRAREVKAMGTVNGLPRMRVKHEKEINMTCY